MPESNPYSFSENLNCIFDSKEFFVHHAGNFPGSIYLQSSQGTQGAGLLFMNNQLSHPGRGSYGILADWNQEFEPSNKFNITTLTPPQILLNDFAPAYLQFLSDKGFKPLSSEPSFLIPVNEENLAKRMDRGNKKRYNKALRLELRFQAEENWHPLYDLIKENRNQKGAKLSMNEMEIEFMMQTFPSRCFWFSVLHETQTIAAAFVMQSLENVWQVVYWGHRPGTEEMSPVTFLAAELHQKAHQQGIKWIDLGTASLNGKPNEGLVRFKLNLGAIPSPKYLYIRKAQ